MLGAIIGDIVGSVYEWNNIKTKDFPLFRKDCFFTDDTVMTIAVADALLKGGAVDDFIDSMKRFGKLYPDEGYGGYFRRWLFSDSREPYNSFGNGSAMRVSPCGWFAESLEEAEDLAERSAAVTHDHPEGIKGAQATAAAIYLARVGKTKDEIKDYIERRYCYDLSRTLDEIRPGYTFDGSCQGTVPEAIIAFLESTRFEGAIRNAISLGGDSDTLAAITGSIAEAAYGFESVIATNAFYYLDDTLSAVMNAWLDEGTPMGAVARKSDWKTDGFAKTTAIKTGFRLTETQYARAHYGLLPEAMEDKWFAYFDDGRINFHRSWTGAKIYEAKIEKTDGGYAIPEIIVSRDPAVYTNESDSEDVGSFSYLLGRGLLGVAVECPTGAVDELSAATGWSAFGRMITTPLSYYRGRTAPFKVIPADPTNEA
jgi:ADP-ribosylglycohydrolase